MKAALGVAGAGLLAIVCCAGPAVLVGAVAGVGLSAAIGGVGAAVLIALGVVFLLVVRPRRHHCAMPASRGDEPGPRRSTREHSTDEPSHRPRAESRR